MVVGERQRHDEPRLEVVLELEPRSRGEVRNYPDPARRAIPVLAPLSTTQPSPRTLAKTAVIRCLKHVRFEQRLYLDSPGSTHNTMAGVRQVLNGLFAFLLNDSRHHQLIAARALRHQTF